MHLDASGPWIPAFAGMSGVGNESCHVGTLSERCDPDPSRLAPLAPQDEAEGVAEAE
jgi:hypothetical protein